MARTKTDEDGQRIPSEAALAGILALMIDARDRDVGQDKSARKTELILSEAGLAFEEIAAVTGKKKDAVRMVVQRRKGR